MGLFKNIGIGKIKIMQDWYDDHVCVRPEKDMLNEDGIYINTGCLNNMETIFDSPEYVVYTDEVLFVYDKCKTRLLNKFSSGKFINRNQFPNLTRIVGINTESEYVDKLCTTEYILDYSVSNRAWTRIK